MAYKQKGFSGFYKKSEKLSKAEADAANLKDLYSQLGTNFMEFEMENPYSNIPVHRREANLYSQQANANQADILGEVRESAGGSGAAGLAQALAQESQRAAQISGSKIGDQERENQMKEREFEAYIQDKEREGVILSREAEKDKVETMLGMSLQNEAAHKEIAAASEQAKWDAIQGGVEGLSNSINS